MGAPFRYPPALSIVRFLGKAESIRRNPIPFHHRFFAELGDTFSIQIGRKKHVILSRDNEVAQYILQKNQKNYRKSALQTVFISKYLGNGLLTANGEFWLRQRRMIQPAFHKQQLHQLVDTMQRTIASELTDLETDKPVDLFPVMNNLAFNVVAKTLFHLSADAAKMDRLKYIIITVQEFLIKEIRVPYKGWWYKLTGQVAAHRKLALEADAILQKIVDARLASGQKPNDLLDMLLDTRYEDTGEPMPAQQLIDEIKILFIAGHETTANALTFTMHLLGNHLEIQQRVFEELSAIDAHLDWVGQLQQMPYTNAVVNESMRLYPPAWITDRENIAPDDLVGYHIAPNTLIGVSFYELHRNPKYWPDPDVFDPERFMGDEKKRSMQYFYPFGAGPRMCIGSGFAVYEMALAVAHLVRNYRIAASGNLSLNPLITLKPVGVQVTFSKR